MPDPTHTFGAGTDPLGITIAGMDIKSVSTSTSKDNAVHSDNVGEYVPATDTVFNSRDEVTVEYEANVNTAIGGDDVPVISGNYAVTAIAIRTTNTGHARLTITAHLHNGGTSAAHTANAREITLPAFNGFGATDFMGSSLADTDVTSGDWSAAIGHVDRQNNVGDFLCGRPTGVRIDATSTAVTDTVPASDPSAWKLDRKEIAKAAEDFYTVTIAGHQYLAAPA